jgi:hypothetical protein
VLLVLPVALIVSAAFWLWLVVWTRRAQANSRSRIRA